MKLMSFLFNVIILTSLAFANDNVVQSFYQNENLKHERPQDMKYEKEIPRFSSKVNHVESEMKKSMPLRHSGSANRDPCTDRVLENQPNVKFLNHQNMETSRYPQEQILEDTYHSYGHCKVDTGVTESLGDIVDHGRFHAPNLFNCSHSCVCENLTFSSTRWVYADCIRKNLTMIPAHLPTRTIYLKISQNNITRINFTRALKYHYLKELVVQSSNIRVISLVTSGKSHWLKKLDLSSNLIKSCSGGLFTVFPHLQELYLTGNLIEHLKNDSFDGLQDLKTLELSFNNIQNIDCDSFKSLRNLEVLCLAKNTHLGYDEVKFPPALFRNMTRLKSLNIQGSSNGATGYPNKAVGALTSLQELNIDALANPAEFGVEFKNLTLLRILRFGPYADCRLVNMSKSFFQYFPHLTCLYYDSCNIREINSQAHASLENLTAITIKSIPSMTLDCAFDDLVNFQQSSLKYVGFMNLTHWYWPCIWMTKNESKYATHLNLTTINLSDNRLSLLADSFLDALPKTIEKMILKNNKFTLINPLWTSLINFTKLTYIDVSVQNMQDLNRRHFIVPPVTEFAPKNEYIYNKLINDEDVSAFHNQGQLNPNAKVKLDDPIFDNRNTMNVPVNLKIVKASWYNYYGSILLKNSIGTNSLRCLNFSRSSLNYWGEGAIPSGVEVLDLRKNSCRKIGPNFFKINNSLTYLYLHVNNLGSFIGNSTGDLMQHLNKLIYLDLSMNQIYQFHFDFFKGLKKVEKIKLRDNRVNELNVSFEHTPELTYLDLRRNALSNIVEVTRKQLDKLAMKESGMVIDLHYNSLLCTCAYIDMLQWMSYTKVYFLNQALYTCRDENNNVINIESRDAMLQQVYYLHRHCVSKGYLIVGCSALGLVFVLTIVAGLAYRYRWWIRYKKHVFVAKWFGFKPSDKGKDSNVYRYDAFLLYAEDDRQYAVTCSHELEKNRQHRFCIGDRDILPGTSELGAIVSAVQNSRFTLVLITDNFVDDMKNNFMGNPMLLYAIQMAVMEEYCTNRKTLHIIQCAHYNNVKYPPYLLKVFHDECTSLFPLDEDSVTSEMVTVFWNKLSETIGHTTKPQTDEDDHGVSFFLYR